VLQQSYAKLEAIVVIDGPDRETAHLLQDFEDDRLRLIMLEENVGGSEARNIGVRAARGEWVAFLDDDDQWMPTKLAKQMEAAAGSRAEYPIVSSRLLARGLDAERVLPQRLYVSGESMADYLFCRKRFVYGEGLLQTSTLLTKRKLLIDVPFQKGLNRHQDWDWLLKAARRPDVEVVMLPEALTLMQVEGQSGSVSRAADWRPSFEWVKSVRRFMSARAYAFFITTECVPRALKCGAGAATILRLLWECVWRGQPGVRQMMLLACFCLIPEGVRKSLRVITARTTSVAGHRGCVQA